MAITCTFKNEILIDTMIASLVGNSIMLILYSIAVYRAFKYEAS